MVRRAQVYGERWAVRSRRIQRESPHGPRKGWALRCVIVKSGDDCRQVRRSVLSPRASSGRLAPGATALTSSSPSHAAGLVLPPRAHEQEVLALQLIRTFGEIFAEASLPLWVRPYEILVTSNK